MPSPYGTKRGASSYYEHAGIPRHYAYRWDGIPLGPTRAGETRGLSDYEKGEEIPYAEIQIAPYADLGCSSGGCKHGPGLGCDDAGASDFIDITATYRKSLGDYPVSMSMEDPRASVRHSGMEQSRIYDGLGIFGFSRNENRLAVVAALGAAGFIAWKLMK